MQRIGRYRIDGEIGRGATGVVYLAEDPHLRRRLAVKAYDLPGGLSGSEEREFRQRFLREAQAAGALNHPAIVTIYDADEDPETHRPYIAMEHVDGPSLREVLRDRGRLPAAEAMEIAAALGDALAAAHEAGIVHRDIKPANILVRSSDGAVKLADFGVARLSSSDLTRTGETLGSPAYMSPEQFRGEAVDGRSDLFSLAVVLYEMLSGEKPFAGDDLASLAYAVVHETPVPISRRDAPLPEGIDVFFDRALAKDPARRPAGGAEFAKALREMLGRPARHTPSRHDPDATVAVASGSEGIRSVLRHVRGIPARRLRIAAVTAAGIALIVSALFWFLGHRATLVLEGRNSIEIGELTLLVDGEEVYTRPLGARRKEARLFGKKLFEYGQEKYEARIGVSPGRHEVLARVATGESDGPVYEDSAVLVLEPGDDRRIRLISGRSGSAVSLKID